MSARVDSPDATVALIAAAPELGEAMRDFATIAFTGSRVDILTRELMRITSGRLSHCQFCGNGRVRGAVDRGLDEKMVAKLDDADHSDLSDRHKLAVHLCNAFLTDPSGVTAAGRAALAEEFRPEQVAELILDLIRLRPGSKLHIAAGFDEGHDEPFLL